MTHNKLLKQIAELEDKIANFAHTHGNHAGCNMRTMTLQSMQYHLDRLYKQLYQ